MKQKKIAIIGAGLSGLTLAYFLNKNHPEISIEIFEKNSQVGGKIQLKKIQDDEIPFGPKTVVLKENEALDHLLQELDLKKEIILPDKAARKRKIAFEGKLIEVPSSIFGLLKRPFCWLLLPLIKEIFTPKNCDDETVETFFCRRFSKKITNAFIDPVFKGIYGSKISELSIKETLGFLKAWEIKYGSILKGLTREKRSKRQIFAFKRGLMPIVEALVEKTKVQIHLDSEIKNLFTDDKKSFEKVVVATDLNGLVELFPEFYHHFGSHFSQSITQVVLRYNQNLPFHEFGFLIPSSESTSALGVLFDSAIFKTNDSNKTYLTVMIEGANKNNEEYIKIAKETLIKYLNLQLEPDFSSIERYDRGIFLPKVGHQDNLERFLKEVQTKYPEVFILGGGLKGVGIADQVQNAYDLAKEILKKT